ncbi:unnamed protein product [Calypogeia fissa]
MNKKERETEEINLQYFEQLEERQRRLIRKSMTQEERQRRRGKDEKTTETDRKKTAKSENVVIRHQYGSGASCRETVPANRVKLTDQQAGSGTGPVTDLAKKGGMQRKRCEPAGKGRHSLVDRGVLQLS